MTTIADVKQGVRDELQIRYEAEELSKDYYAFVRGAWHIIEKHTRFKENWHIQAICESLMSVSSGEVRNLQIWVPPGSMKSILANILWNAWEWTHSPWLRYLTGSYADDLAQDFSGLTRKVVTDQWYQERWPTAMRADLNQKGDFANMEGGRRIATSPSGTATGRHAHRIVIDDPLKPMEVASDVALEKVNRWYDGTLATRAADATTVAEVIIMQRLHENDLAAHALQYADWEIVCLPERYDPSHPFLWPRDERSTDGELLWPSRVGDRENKIRTKKLGGHQAAGQLQQNPTAREGDLLKRKDWRYFDRKILDREPQKLTFDRIITSWDTAFKDKTTSDYVVGQVWGARGADYFFLRTIREQMALGATKRSIREFEAWVRSVWPHLPLTHVVEKSANGVEILDELKREIPGLKPWPASVDKVQRAMAAQPTLESNNCFLPGVGRSDNSDYDPALTPGWVTEFVEECAQFNKGTNDDQVDAWSQAINYLNSTTSQMGGLYVAEGEI